MRVAVHVGLGPVEPAARAEQIDEHRVGVLEEAAGHRLHLGPKPPVETDSVQHGQPVLHPEPEVIRSVGGRGVHDPGTLVRGHEVRRAHPVGGVRPLRRGLQKVERRIVAKAGEVAPLDDLLDGGSGGAALPEHRRDPRGGEDQALAADPHPRVVHVRVHREGEIGGEGPRSRGPDQERSLVVAASGRAVAPVAAATGAIATGGGAVECRRARVLAPVRDRETDVYGRILDFLVSERNLVRRQGGPDPGVVGHHLVPAVEKPLVPDDPEQMPHRLDVVVVERVVGVLHVHPEAHSLGHPLPVADVAHDRFTASPGELLDADLPLDPGLVEDPELLLDLVLDGQAVRIPAGPARAVVAAHGLVAGNRSLKVRARTWWSPGLPFAVGGPSFHT